MSPLASPEKRLDLNFKQGSIFDQFSSGNSSNAARTPREHLACPEIRASVQDEDIVIKKNFDKLVVVG